ncbi:hypothetical protein [Aurantimonas endophytica]|uniref:DNA-directed RNA polymerase subunit RPC12/RpoP n=1 Tax=Aurantimonas endophytica TaxID=1522175 RepID=A0A7W6HEQ7_9HYPH|nr:hypothetical protein [Aurantimonas endophytica]MBB4003849.1 DNA-directed RNA polymerase subunit RPC12/RpoP [Aurantimonas endophytica]MCO6404700.1 hypothetical protein [Aurantimonas endophytica]
MLTPIIISTLDDLLDEGMGLAWICEGCSRDLDMTLGRAIEIWGRDQRYVRWHPPVKCARCGSRDISMRVRANTIKQATGTPFER